MSKNPDSDFVLRGRTSSYWSRPGYLSNTRLTTTSHGFDDYSAEDYKDSYRDIPFTHSLRALSNNLLRVSSDLKQSVHDTNKLRSLHSSLRTSVTEDELLRLMKKDLTARDSYHQPSTNELNWYTSPLRSSRSHVRSSSNLSEFKSPSYSGTQVRPRSLSPNYYRSSTSEVPLGPILHQNISTYERVGQEMDLKRNENMDALAAKYFPVTLGAEYYMQASDSNTGISKKVQDGSKVRSSASKISNLSKSAKARCAARTDELLNDVEYKRDSGHTFTTDVPFQSSSSVSAVTVTPYQAELARLRMERLRFEEDLLLELKRQEELERIRGPKPKWYELKSRQFHHEAHKNNQLIRSRGMWDDIFAYREELDDASKMFKRSYNSQATVY